MSPFLLPLMIVALFQSLMPATGSEEFCARSSVVPFKSDVNGNIGYIDIEGRVAILPQYEAPTIGFPKGAAATLTGEPVVLAERIMGERFFEGLAAVKLNTRYGFIDTCGRLVIPPQFTDARQFSEGKAAVLTENRWGYIDQTGKIVIAPSFEDAGPFSEGLAPVLHGNRWHFIDQHGNQVTGEFFAALPFSEGLAAVDYGESFGYIRPDGSPAFGQRFKGAGPFSAGLAPVEIEKGGYRFIDRKGNWAFEQKYDSAKPFSQGLALISRNSRYGYIDPDGQEIIAPQFAEALSFSEGLAAVRRPNSIFEYIDHRGATVIKTESPVAHSFHGGLALIKTNAPAPVPSRSLRNGLIRLDIGYAYINRFGKIVFQGAIRLMGLPPTDAPPAPISYYELSRVDVTVDSRPRGVTVYIIPWMIWEEAKKEAGNPLESGELRLNSRKNPTLLVDKIYQDVYIFVLDYQGRREVLKRDINATADRKIFVDFTTP